MYKRIGYPKDNVQDDYVRRSMRSVDVSTPVDSDWRLLDSDLQMLAKVMTL